MSDRNERFEDIAESAKFMKEAMIRNGFNPSDVEGMTLRWMELQYSKVAVLPKLATG